jgi:hypothetical protein
VRGVYQYEVSAHPRGAYPETVSNCADDTGCHEPTEDALSRVGGHVEAFLQSVDAEDKARVPDDVGHKALNEGGALANVPAFVCLHVP